MTTQLEMLKAQLESLYDVMPNTHYEMSQRDKSAFLLSREIEKLENPNLYEANKGHWEGHELRF